MRTGCVLTLITAGLCFGCIQQPPQQAAPKDQANAGSLSMRQMSDSVGVAPLADQVPATPTAPLAGEPKQPPTQPAFASGAQQPPAAPPAPKPSAGPEGRAVPAGVGVGARGRSLDKESGILVQPAKSLFAFSERAVFNIQIPHAMQLFEGAEGRKPKSHEEFMSRIIRENNIQLPRLPEGQRYQYDPERGELMVYGKAR